MRGRQLLSSFGALRNRRFRRVWIGGMVSQTGNWMQITGRAALIYRATGSAGDLGIIYFLTYLPQLLMSQFAGLIVDRYDRRKVLLTCQLLATLGAFSMGVIAVTDTASLVTVGTASILIGFVQTVLGPAQQSLVRGLVQRRDLTSAITLNSATQAFTRILGPLLAGVVAETLDIPWLFWINTASFLVVLVIWFRTPVPRQPAMAETRVFAAIAAGFRLAWREPALRVAVATTLIIGGIALMYQPMGLAFATDVLAGGDDDRGTTYYTYFQAALGLGSLVGILGLADLAKRRPAYSVKITSFGVTVGVAVLGIVDTLVPALLLGFVIGGCHFATNTLLLNTIQHRTPDEMQGRVLSIHMIAFVGPLPIISVVGGWLAEIYSIAAVLTGTGILCFLYCVPLLRWSRHLAGGHIYTDDEHQTDESIAVAEENLG